MPAPLRADNTDKVNKLAKEMISDERRPTPENLSGTWTSGPDLTGLTLQLDQKGGIITGKGCSWGCVGVSDLLTVSGTSDQSEHH